jgi:hypothetical protein
VHVRVRPLALREGTTPAARVTDDGRHVVLLRRLAPHHEIDTSPSRGRRVAAQQPGSNENASLLAAVDATRLSFTRSVTGGASPAPRLASLHPNAPGRPVGTARTGPATTQLHRSATSCSSASTTVATTRARTPGPTNAASAVAAALDAQKQLFTPATGRRPSPSSCHYGGSSSAAASDATMTFAFDRAYGEDAGQSDVFEGSVAEAFEGCLDLGRSAAILCYGPTGSGKSHTVIGPPALRHPGAGAAAAVDGPSAPPSDTTRLAGYEYAGILARVLDAAIGIRRSKARTLEGAAVVASVAVAAVEVYGEQVRDLLGVAKPCIARLWDQGNSIAEVLGDGLTWLTVHGMADVNTTLSRANEQRVVCSHKQNADSSRSHALFIVRLEHQYLPDDARGQQATHTVHTRTPRAAGQVSSYFTLVDLAGTERVKQTGVTGSAMLEAQAINKSLTCLSNVVSALHRGAEHVPFRDSKLTRLLRPLCVDAITTSRQGQGAGSSEGAGEESLPPVLTIIVHIPPGPEQQPDAVMTLNLAGRMKTIPIAPSVEKQRFTFDDYDTPAARERQEHAALQRSIEAQQAAVHQLVGDLLVANAEHGVVPRRLKAAMEKAASAAAVPVSPGAALPWAALWAGADANAAQPTTTPGVAAAQVRVDCVRRRLADVESALLDRVRIARIALDDAIAEDRDDAEAGEVRAMEGVKFIKRSLASRSAATKALQDGRQALAQLSDDVATLDNHLSATASGNTSAIDEPAERKAFQAVFAADAEFQGLLDGTVQLFRRVAFRGDRLSTLRAAVARGELDAAIAAFRVKLSASRAPTMPGDGGERDATIMALPGHPALMCGLHQLLEEHLTPWPERAARVLTHGLWFAPSASGWGLPSHVPAIIVKSPSDRQRRHHWPLPPRDRADSDGHDDNDRSAARHVVASLLQHQAKHDLSDSLSPARLRLRKDVSGGLVLETSAFSQSSEDGEELEPSERAWTVAVKIGESTRTDRFAVSVESPATARDGTAWAAHGLTRVTFVVYRVTSSDEIPSPLAPQPLRSSAFGSPTASASATPTATVLQSLSCLVEAVHADCIVAGLWHALRPSLGRRSSFGLVAPTTRPSTQPSSPVNARGSPKAVTRVPSTRPVVLALASPPESLLDIFVTLDAAVAVDLGRTLLMRVARVCAPYLGGARGRSVNLTVSFADAVAFGNLIDDATGPTPAAVDAFTMAALWPLLSKSPSLSLPFGDAHTSLFASVAVDPSLPAWAQTVSHMSSFTTATPQDLETD